MIEEQNVPEKIVQTKEPDLPSFYYEVDEDRDYNAEEILDMCKMAHNKAVVACIKTMDRHFNGTHMRNFRTRIALVLGKNLI